MIDLPRPLMAVLEAVRQVGRPRIVGGCVRDALLGQIPGDIDIEVAETDFDTLLGVLKPFGSTDVVGRSFGTIKLRLKNRFYDFSLPRRESKTGSGHRGFKIEPDPSLDDVSAAARRDFTINAMAWDPFTRELIDPFDGQADLHQKVLRHPSPAFVEDPLRVLRAMQLAARLDFTLDPSTSALSRSIQDDFAQLPTERIWGEWEKWATTSLKPSRGLEVLCETGWISHFPEISALIDVPQDPEWHPEGDVFVHTKCCLDALVADQAWIDADADRREILLLAVLAHDFGKPTTTEQVEKKGQLRWTSPRHAVAGLPPTLSFLKRIGAPHRLADEILPLVKFHMAHLDSGDSLPSDAQIRRLARKLAPARLDDLLTVMRADSRGRPPREDPATLDRLAHIASRATVLEVQAQAPKPLVQGRHLLARGMKAGPDFAPLLEEAYEAQLSGAFLDEPSSSEWLDSRLKL